MSNKVIGDVYDRIIHEVIEASKNDFEESGVSQNTLLQLQETWQKKLSTRNIAQLPWDPQPQAPQVANTPTLPSNVSGVNAMSAPAYAQGQHQTKGGGVRIKTEPGLEPAHGSYPQANGYPQAGPGMNPQLAQQRAATLLQQQFGSQANASLARGGITLPGQQKPPFGLQLPGQQHAQQQAQQQYAQQQAQHIRQQNAQHQQQVQQQARIKVETSSPHDGHTQYPPQSQQQQQSNRTSNLTYAQTDGAGDEWRTFMAQRRAVSTQDAAHADCTLRDHVAQLAQQMDSGLMVPLNKQKKPKYKSRRFVEPAVDPAVTASSDNPMPRGAIPQLDGVGSDDDRTNIKDEDDEDAINSDLDDPEEAEAEVEDDEDEAHETMLCTYDKVQRVKNKWKCTLKDGLLHTGGKE
ncbi:hypothetical protein LTR66_007006 [Elasticomyces elasticus]|nr:hypothetical protein LTR66_007006 [Elasticomyces elasticus]